MTVHLVSVGLSLRNSLVNKPDQCLDGDHEDVLHALIDRASEMIPASGDLIRHRRHLSEQLVPGTPLAADLAAEIGEVRPDLWLSRVSAELASLARYSDSRSKPLPRKARLGSRSKDTVVLLATDTVPGLRSALWNALALTSGDPTRIVWFANPQDTVGHAAGRVIIAPIPGLAVGGDTAMFQAMGSLGRLGHTLIRHIVGPGADYVFHLSGGYKATIPYLIGLAEGMRGLVHNGEVASVSAYVLHEDDLNSLIRLPLRVLPYEVLEKEFEGVDKNDQPSNGMGRRLLPMSPHRLLEGYAYERHREEWRLTPFGEGLIHLIP
ncbi:hypothetical protein FOF52_06390 [Thermobifida alba]|uniref:CRISPR system ring nuclease SSO1393-like domain-containing protein n=1 Tax=Thermobifida alba TaxID=53522 RepID=A0ABY4KYZ5_THEAE|nr:hypothetical protein [Thermobifida alba]UPT20641.1 hypothetical protein FOF52_06390 [Thermobifida alba]